MGSMDPAGIWERQGYLRALLALLAFLWRRALFRLAFFGWGCCGGGALASAVFSESVSDPVVGGASSGLVPFFFLRWRAFFFLFAGTAFVSLFGVVVVPPLVGAVLAAGASTAGLAPPLLRAFFLVF